MSFAGGPPPSPAPAGPPPIPKGIASTAEAESGAAFSAILVAAYLAQVRRAVLVRDLRAAVALFCDRAAPPMTQRTSDHAAVRDALAASIAAAPPCYHVQHLLLLHHDAGASGAASSRPRGALTRPRLSGPDNELAEQILLAVFSQYACPTDATGNLWLLEGSPATQHLTLWQWRALMLDAGIGDSASSPELDAVFLGRCASTAVGPGSPWPSSSAAAKALLAGLPPLLGSVGPALPYSAFAQCLVDAAATLLPASAKTERDSLNAAAAAVAVSILRVAESEGQRLAALFEARCERVLEMATGQPSPGGSATPIPGSPRSPHAVSAATSPRLDHQRSFRGASGGGLDPSVSRPVLRLPLPLREALMLQYGVVVVAPTALRAQPLEQHRPAPPQMQPSPIAFASTAPGDGGRASVASKEPSPRQFFRAPPLVHATSDPGVSAGTPDSTPYGRLRAGSTSSQQPQRARAASISSVALGGDVTPAAAASAADAQQLLAASSDAMVAEAQRSALPDTPAMAAALAGRRSSRPIVTELRPGADDAAVIARRIDAMHSARRRSSVLAPPGAGTIGSSGGTSGRKMSTPQGHAAAAAAAAAAFASSGGTSPTASKGASSPRHENLRVPLRVATEYQATSAASLVRIHASPTSAFSSRPSQLHFSSLHLGGVDASPRHGALTSVLLKPFESDGDGRGESSLSFGGHTDAAQQGTLGALTPFTIASASSAAPVDAAGFPRGGGVGTGRSTGTGRSAGSARSDTPPGALPAAASVPPIKSSRASASSSPAAVVSPKEASGGGGGGISPAHPLVGTPPLGLSPVLQRVRRMSVDQHSEGVVLPPSVMNALLRQRMQPLQDALLLEGGGGGHGGGAADAALPTRPLHEGAMQRPASGRSSAGLGVSTRQSQQQASGTRRCGWARGCCASHAAPPISLLTPLGLQPHAAHFAQK